MMVLETRSYLVPQADMELDMEPKLDFQSPVQPVPPHLNGISLKKKKKSFGFWGILNFTFRLQVLGSCYFICSSIS